MPFRLRKSPQDQSILHALLPGTRLDKNTNKILVRTSTTDEAIQFNVGGTYFETYKSTLRAIPHSLLADDNFLKKHHRPKQNDYFFDRDPKIFHCILNYLRSGELHLPTSVCGPVVKSELEYWGIEEIEIEECCWSRYSTWSTTLQSLRKLEADRKGFVLQWQTADDKGKSCLNMSNLNAWNFFVDPNSSLASTIYGYVSLVVIFLSIFCFCVGTHGDFQITSTVRETNGSYITTNTSSPGTPTSAATTNQSPITSSTTTSDQSYDKVTEQKPHPILYYVDFTCFILIFVELMVRFVVCPIKIRFLSLPITVIECLALLPDVIEIILQLAEVDHSKESLNFMRTFRVFRLFRMVRQIPGLWTLLYTLKASVKDLLLLLLFLCLGMLTFSSLVYFAEKDEADTQFTSIPMCFWWTIITMTTVGYGDMSPETRFGYLVGTMTAISGLLMIGFTVPVLVNNFVLYYHHTQSAIDREKQREKTKKRLQAKKDSLERAKRDSNSNGSSQMPGLFFNFEKFKQLSNGSGSKITPKEADINGDNDKTLKTNWKGGEEIPHSDLIITTDDTQRRDATELHDKDITSL